MFYKIDLKFILNCQFDIFILINVIDHMIHMIALLNELKTLGVEINEKPRMKISVITYISVFRFYGYIRDILMDILT